MHWTPVTTTAQIDELIEKSRENPVVLLKHSTRCGISSVVLDRLSRQWEQDTHPDVLCAIIDVIASREVSNYVADKLAVRHESPQVLLLHNGKQVYNASHMGINFAVLSREILAQPS